MKSDIHPKIYTDCVVNCACGNTFTTISTTPKIMVEICSACHPFFTGTQKLIDTEGRVDKFAKRQALAERNKTQKKADDARKADNRSPKTLKEMLTQSTTDK